jgi:hypothetical protein
MQVYFFLPSTDHNTTVEEMIKTFGYPLEDHARDKLGGLDHIAWRYPGRPPPNGAGGTQPNGAGGAQPDGATGAQPTSTSLACHQAPSC